MSALAQNSYQATLANSILLGIWSKGYVFLVVHFGLDYVHHGISNLALLQEILFPSWTGLSSVCEQ